jgi:acetyltransferase-like isoleucine patch superfamily enzyme
VGSNVTIWHYVQIREHAIIGDNVIIGSYVYIGAHVVIGSNVKIQVGAKIFNGITIEDGVFIGPGVCFCNDTYPRAINSQGALRDQDEWNISKTLVRYGCSIGANATVLPGVVIGRFSMVGASATVVQNVADYGLIVGNPGKLIGYVCTCGHRLQKDNTHNSFYCSLCNKQYVLTGETLEET